MDHVARQLQHRHAREELHLGAVAGEEGCGGGAAVARLRARLAAGEDKAGGHALDVPLERAADGLVEIVDVEDEAAVKRGEGAQVCLLYTSRCV